MAWEARSGLKRTEPVETVGEVTWLNGLGSPFGIETRRHLVCMSLILSRLNGLGSPFGIETEFDTKPFAEESAAKWPGKPVRD